MHELKFGRLVIHWSGPEFPIAVNHTQLNGDKPFVTATAVVYYRGHQSITVPIGYAFDGASIPRIFWLLPGFAPLGKHIWAALAHDFACDNPEEIDRPIADGWFETLLLDTGVSGWRAVVMWNAVTAYRKWNNIKRWMQSLAKDK